MFERRPQKNSAKKTTTNKQINELPVIILQIYVQLYLVPQGGAVETFFSLSYYLKSDIMQNTDKRYVDKTTGKYVSSSEASQFYLRKKNYNLTGAQIK